MKKCLILMFALFASISLFSQNDQYRVVASAGGGWTTLSDTTFSAVVVLESDQTANGFDGLDVTDTMLVFTPTMQRYTVDSIISQGAVSVSLRVKELDGDWGEPVGKLMIYEDEGRPTVPDVPVGSFGSSVQLEAGIDTYNSQLATNINWPDSNVVYASNYGDVVGVLGSPIQPWDSIHLAYDAISTNGGTVVIRPGVYTKDSYTPTGDDDRLNSPATNQPVTFTDQGNPVTLNLSNLPNYFDVFGDKSDDNTTDPVDLNLDLSNTTLNIDREGAALYALSFYNDASRVKARIHKIVSGQPDSTEYRLWGLRIGAKSMDVEVDSLLIEGTIPVSFTQSTNDAGTILQNREGYNQKVKIGLVYLPSPVSDANGAFRLQWNVAGVLSDTSGVYILEVDRFEYGGGTFVEGGYAFWTSADMVDGKVVADLGEVVNIHDTQELMFSDGVFAWGVNDSIFNSEITFKADKIENATEILGILPGGGADGTFVNSTVNIIIGEGNNAGDINLDPMQYWNSRINIHCDDCDGSQVLLNHDAGDSTTTVTISGSWKTSAAEPLINITSQGLRIVLKDILLENDGTVPTIQSTGTQEILVAGAYDGNEIILDPDISFSYNEYLTYAPNEWYVDNATGLGSDNAPGNQVDRPFETLGKLMTVLQNNDKVFLRRGSYWREEIHTSTISGVEITAYGVGDPPLIDGTNISTDWTKLGGYTNIYVDTFFVEGALNQSITAAFLPAFEDGEVLPWVVDLTTLDATPGRMFYEELGSGEHIIFIHTSDSADPTTNDSYYEITVRTPVRFSNGPAWVEGVETRANVGPNGSIDINTDDGYVSDMLLRDGHKHSGYLNYGTFENVVAYRTSQLWSPFQTTTHFVFFDGTDTTRAGRYINCWALELNPEDYLASSVSNAFFAHTGVGGAEYQRIDIVNSHSYNVDQLIGGDIDTVVVTNSSQQGANAVALGNTGIEYATFDRYVVEATGTGNGQAADYTIATNCAFVNAADAVTGGVLLRFAPTDTLDISNSVFYSRLDRPLVGTASGNSGGHFSSNYNVFFTDSYFSGDINLGDSISSYTGDYNVFFRNTAQEMFIYWKQNYTDLSEWQDSTGQDANSVWVSQTQAETFWITDPATGEFSINPFAKVTSATGTEYTGTFPDGTPLSNIVRNIPKGFRKPPLLIEEAREIIKKNSN